MIAMHLFWKSFVEGSKNLAERQLVCYICSSRNSLIFKINQIFPCQVCQCQTFDIIVVLCRPAFPNLHSHLGSICWLSKLCNVRTSSCQEGRIEDFQKVHQNLQEVELPAQERVSSSASRQFGDSSVRRNLRVDVE